MKNKLLQKLSVGILISSLLAGNVFAINFDNYQGMNLDEITNAVLSDPSSEYYGKDAASTKEAIRGPLAEYYKQKAEQQKQQQQPEQQQKPPEMPKMPEGGGGGGEQKSNGDKGGEKGNSGKPSSSPQPEQPKPPKADPQEGAEVEKDEGIFKCICDKKDDATKCSPVSPTKLVRAKSLVGGAPVDLIGPPGFLSGAKEGGKYTKDKKLLPPEPSKKGKFLGQKCTLSNKGGKPVWKVQGGQELRNPYRPMGPMKFS